jgi:hypothetical protein
MSYSRCHAKSRHGHNGSVDIKTPNGNYPLEGAYHKALDDLPFSNGDASPVFDFMPNDFLYFLTSLSVYLVGKIHTVLSYSLVKSMPK